MQPCESQAAGSAGGLSLMLEKWSPFLRRCAVVEELCCQVEELQEEVNRLHSVRGDEREMDRIFSETLQLQSPESQLQWRHWQSLSLAEPSVETLRKAKAGSL